MPKSSKKKKDKAADFSVRLKYRCTMSCIFTPLEIRKPNSNSEKANRFRTML